ncbi:hypothetical protein INR49_005697 [Caranx melampygus]|nr:hypothetical protein INR49_005697 [Caranx melampygus]
MPPPTLPSPPSPVLSPVYRGMQRDRISVTKVLFFFTSSCFILLSSAFTSSSLMVAAGSSSSLSDFSPAGSWNSSSSSAFSFAMATTAGGKQANSATWIPKLWLENEK